MSDSVNLPPAALPPRCRRRWLRWLLWLIVFGSGFVAGVGLTLIGVRKGLLEAIQHPETMPRKMAQRLRRPLQLNDEQMRRIERIVAERQQALQQIRIRVQPEVDAELDVIQREIAQVLDEQQRTKWEQLFRQLRSTWLPPPQQPGIPSHEASEKTTSSSRKEICLGGPILRWRVRLVCGDRLTA